MTIALTLVLRLTFQMHLVTAVFPSMALYYPSSAHVPLLIDFDSRIFQASAQQAKPLELTATAN